jgi:hypothetical protein
MGWSAVNGKNPESILARFAGIFPFLPETALVFGLRWGCWCKILRL